MKLKLKLCSGCGEPKQIWKNSGGDRYCRSCWARTGVAKKSKREPRPKQSIPFRSSKKQKLDILYGIARRKFLDDHPMCHAHIDARCTKKSTEVHHKAGRIAELYLDQTYWLPACHNCHVWCELHPEEAKALGLSIDRLSLKNHENTGPQTLDSSDAVEV